MTLKFKKDASKHSVVNEPNVVYLSLNNWDDYSYKTTFHATLVDSAGLAHKIGDLKIGYIRQGKG